jgi:hypothetical protein
VGGSGRGKDAESTLPSEDGRRCVPWRQRGGGGGSGGGGAGGGRGHPSARYADEDDFHTKMTTLTTKARSALSINGARLSQQGLGEEGEAGEAEGEVEAVGAAGAAAAADLKAHEVGPRRYCSPRHRMSCN